MKYMKKLGWVAIGVVLAGVLSAYAPAGTHKSSPLTGNSSTLDEPTDKNSTPFTEVNYLETSFTATNANVDGYLIHNWSQLNDNFMSERELRQAADKLKQDLHIQGAKWMTHADASENFEEVYGSWSDNTDISVTLSSMRYSSTQSTTVLVVHAHHAGKGFVRLASEVAMVRKAVTNSGCAPQISTCIEGFTNARMMGVQVDGLVTRAFSAVGAHRVEGVKSDLVTSISGYSSKAPGYIQTNGQKMNLQVAVHYDAYHHRTNVLVGTPIITETY
jgi:hypothetical protein